MNLCFSKHFPLEFIQYFIFPHVESVFICTLPNACQTNCKIDEDDFVFSSFWFEGGQASSLKRHQTSKTWIRHVNDSIHILTRKSGICSGLSVIRFADIWFIWCNNWLCDGMHIYHLLFIQDSSIVIDCTLKTADSGTYNRITSYVYVHISPIFGQIYYIPFGRFEHCFN